MHKDATLDVRVFDRRFKHSCENRLVAGDIKKKHNIRNFLFDFLKLHNTLPPKPECVGLSNPWKFVTLKFLCISYYQFSCCWICLHLLLPRASLKTFQKVEVVSCLGVKHGNWCEKSQEIFFKETHHIEFQEKRIEFRSPFEKKRLAEN